MEEIKKDNELSEEKLAQVSGGELPVDYVIGDFDQYGTETVLRRDSRGNPVYWQRFRDGKSVTEPFFYVCPHCGRVLHEGALERLYCDPCNEGWFPFNLPSGCKRYGSFPG